MSSAQTRIGHLLDVVDADENSLSALVQDGQFLGELSLVDGGRSHGTGAMHLAASRLVRERRSTKLSPRGCLAALLCIIISNIIMGKHAHVTVYLRRRAHSMSRPKRA